ncbi:MAG: cell division protein FtsQ/DivIB [Bacteroidales bacterium]
MLKRLLVVLLLLLAFAYMVFAALNYAHQPNTVVCSDVSIEIKNDALQTFVKPEDIERILRQQNLFPDSSKRTSEVDFDALEDLLCKHRLVERAECFVSPSGRLMIHVWQHQPILRVVAANDQYYVDVNGKKTALSNHSAADVPVATGFIRDSVCLDRLYSLAQLIRTNETWDDFIEQICVEADGGWTLIPRIGDFELYLGQPIHLERKLNRAVSFVRDYLPQMGWDRYSKIDVSFANQIVCTKND